jgi:hypothetical protein
MGAMGIFSSHLLKLYQFFDDFAWADGGCQPAKRRFWDGGLPNSRFAGLLFALRYGKICDSSHLILNTCRATVRQRP